MYYERDEFINDKSSAVTLSGSIWIVEFWYFMVAARVCSRFIFWMAQLVGEESF